MTSRVDKEAALLKDQLRQVDSPKRPLDVVQCFAVRPDQIQMELLNNEPVILHFSGHGGPGKLCFEDRDGNPVLVDGSLISEIVQAYDGLECIVLNACFSMDVAKACARHLKAVIGCDDSIGDRAAANFTRGFYQAVAHGRDYEAAFNMGKIEVRISDGDEADKYVLLTP